MSKITFPSKAIFMCNGSKCGKHKEVKKYIKQLNKESGTDDKIEIFKMECSDRCKSAPIVYFQPENVWLEKADVAMCKELIEK
ncbi:(2Fe-2S) ferredoxin domain-containing protein [Flavobacterium algicola]|uniref:(2Fe-2S) ferredoxin domain-containing protein n=1 Tax=Flavobacterium algicola TaxID=556529 RepID=UPI001EFCF590|nr:(2Fe-2S) ferredoxin domain-containing protein [Flavobacterium algicola]MCG9792116.1 (2Fe-2S) ferredoxin domain-containing protein [Flavobacterium algicola]